MIFTTARVQDRDGARTVLERLRFTMPSIVKHVDRRRVRRLAARLCAATLRVSIEIIRKPIWIKTCEVLPRRWVVERTLAWIVRHRGDR